jgi:hypothetical protein
MGRGRQVGEVSGGVSKRTQSLTLRHIGFRGGEPGQPSLLSLALLLVAQELERLLRHPIAGLEPLLDLDQRGGFVQVAEDDFAGLEPVLFLHLDEVLIVEVEACSHRDRVAGAPDQDGLSCLVSSLGRQLEDHRAHSRSFVHQLLDE